MTSMEDRACRRIIADPPSTNCASSPWAGSAYDTALRLLSTPSVLVDRGATGGPAPLDGSVEESLLATSFDHPDIVSFGVRGVSTGYAGWSGAAHASLSRERSLTVDELVASWSPAS
ncbi:hypothetical protein [Streptomyces sp. NPDC058092]|uniref:hypothetical protein n=1 Tax=Streptomyces sp. NPDC058092 TaxID=3346336 RepID=UPI0036EEBED3